MSEVVIRVENLSKEYRLGTISHGTLHKDLQSWWAGLRGKDDPNSLITSHNPGQLNDLNERFWALKDISFDVEKGEIVGIIGRNGAGKSTLLKILSRVTGPTTGSVKVKGRIASLLEVGTGFHPELTGRENVYLNGTILGMTRKEIDRKFDEIVDFAEIEKFIDTPVKRYSSGMYVRLAFAVAAYLDPEILIVDEVLAVGDVAFQKKCLGKMGEVAEGGRTVLFVSHNMGAIQQLTERSILLASGDLVLDADTPKVVERYLEISVSEVNTNLKSDLYDFKINSISFNYSTLEKGFNKPLRFDFNLSIENNKKNILIGFAIINSIGSKILTSECILDTLSNGQINLFLILKDHHLPPGNYHLNLGIAVSGNQILYQENVLSFEISDLNIDNPVLVRKRDKIGVYIPCECIVN